VPGQRRAASNLFGKNRVINDLRWSKVWKYAKEWEGACRTLKRGIFEERWKKKRTLRLAIQANRSSNGLRGILRRHSKRFAEGETHIQNG